MTFDKSSYGLGEAKLHLTLVRHGESPWVVDGKSVDDPHLSPVGAIQAGALNRRLQDEKFDHILCSPLTRARETIEVVSGTGSAVDLAPWLAEIRYPDWQGQPSRLAAEALAQMRGLPIEERWAAFAGTGETIADFVLRVQQGLCAFLGSIGVHMRPGGGPRTWDVVSSPQRVLLVGHAGSIAAILSTLMGIEAAPWEWERYQLAYCSVTEMVSFPVNPGHAFSIARLGDVEHLDVPLRKW